MLFSLCSCADTAESEAPENAEKIKLVINGEEFTAFLENNETAEVFEEALPMSLLMSELNGNEKYHYLDYALPNDEQSFVKICKGDIMLYGDRCIVVFYEDNVTAYKYTGIGHIENADRLSEAVGEENVIIEFKR
jgi:hypothetical protein